MRDGMMRVLQEFIESHYKAKLKDRFVSLGGGYECDVWRTGDYVIRMLPDWRSESEVHWTYDFVRRCAEDVSQVIAPMGTSSGDDYVMYDGQAVVLLPYIDGKLLNLADDRLIQQSAQILAQIHLTSAYLPKDSKRPPSKTSQPTDIPKQPDPKNIQDPELDAWYNEFIQRDDLQMGMMHGDYYRGNILCNDGQVVGVIDWDECNYGAIIREVAWSLWEMCHTNNGDALDMDRASLFLVSYRENYPLLSDVECKAIIPLIRYHLRYEIRRSIAMEEAGQDWDDDYRQAEIRAFNNLKTTAL